MDWYYPEGATPLEPEEMAELIPSHITTHPELNEWEQSNILEAELWIAQRTRTVAVVLDRHFVHQLHKKMFDKTWRWAGQFRKTDKNIGIDWRILPTQLQNLLDDVSYQLEHQSYSVNEIATRFHHRMVHIHPFVNGNGRHARLITDALLLALKQPRFTWGKENLTQTSQTRKQYIKALQSADKQDYCLLLDFVRS